MKGRRIKTIVSILTCCILLPWSICLTAAAAEEADNAEVISENAEPYSSEENISENTEPDTSGNDIFIKLHEQAEAQLKEELGAFEITAIQRELAKENEADYSVLDAGRGNPNWINTQSRYAFTRFMNFAMISRSASKF